MNRQQRRAARNGNSKPALETRPIPQRAEGERPLTAKIASEMAQEKITEDGVKWVVNNTDGGEELRRKEWFAPDPQDSDVQGVDYNALNTLLDHFNGSYNVGDFGTAMRLCVVYADMSFAPIWFKDKIKQRVLAVLPSGVSIDSVEVKAAEVRNLLKLDLSDAERKMLTEIMNIMEMAEGADARAAADRAATLPKPTGRRVERLSDLIINDPDMPDFIRTSLARAEKFWFPAEAVDRFFDLAYNHAEILEAALPTVARYPFRDCWIEHEMATPNQSSVISFMLTRLYNAAECGISPAKVIM